MDDIPFTDDINTNIPKDPMASMTSDSNLAFLQKPARRAIHIKKFATGFGLILISIVAMVFANIFVPQYHIPSISPQRVTPAYNGKPVHVVGEVSGQDFTDPLFNITYHGLALQRVVETYQYSADNQEMRWSADIIKDKEEKNPIDVLIPVEHWDVEHITLGVFEISDTIKQTLTQLNPPKLIPLTEAYFAKLSEDGQKALKLFDNHFYFGVNPSTPEIGDIRVQFMGIESPTLSIVAQQQNAALKPFMYLGNPIERVVLGTQNVLQMTSDITIKQYPSLAWILRLVFMIPLFVGIAILVARKPIHVMPASFQATRLKPKKPFSLIRNKKKDTSSATLPSQQETTEDLFKNKEPFFDPSHTPSNDPFSELESMPEIPAAPASPFSVPTSPPPSFTPSAPAPSFIPTPSVDTMEMDEHPSYHEPAGTHRFHNETFSPEFPDNVEIIGSQTDTSFDSEHEHLAHAPSEATIDYSTPYSPAMPSEPFSPEAPMEPLPHEPFADLPPPPPPSFHPEPATFVPQPELPAYAPPPPPFSPPPPPPPSFSPEPEAFAPQAELPSYAPPPPPLNPPPSAPPPPPPPPLVPAAGYMPPPPPAFSPSASLPDEDQDADTTAYPEETSGGFFPPNDDTKPLFPSEPEAAAPVKKTRKPAVKKTSSMDTDTVKKAPAKPRAKKKSADE